MSLPSSPHRQQIIIGGRRQLSWRKTSAVDIAEYRDAASVASRFHFGQLRSHGLFHFGL